MPPLVPPRKTGKPQPTRLGPLLINWMERNGYSIYEVADALGMGKNGWRTVSRWRTGGAIRGDFEGPLARLMGVAVEDFYPPGTFDNPAARNEILDSIGRIEDAIQRLLELVTELAAHLLPGVESDVAQTLGQPGETEPRAGETKRRSQSGREGRSPNGP